MVYMFIQVTTQLVNSKKKIKLLFLKNLNLTPYKLLLLLNPIIREWGNYFAVGTKRVFSRVDHFIWYRSWRWLRRKFKKASTKILVSRFYAGAPTGLAWHFHATWNNASKDLLKRKGKILHIILLTRLTPGIPAQAFKPTKEIINESYFINQEGSINWNTSINKYKSKGNYENFELNFTINNKVYAHCASKIWVTLTVIICRSITKCK